MSLMIAGKQIESRLFVGTGKFRSPQVMQSAVEASGADVVTVAVRRVNFDAPVDSYTTHIDPNKYVFLPNTSGARTAEEAIRIARLAKFSGVSNWVKLEVIPDATYLMPCPIETLKAAEQLVSEGFVVLPYINADPVLAKRLANVGCATVMPLASPIGSNQGLKTMELLRIIIEQSTVPVVIDAGIGAPSQAAQAMELGADAVLVNTAIATAGNPVAMASAFRDAVVAGRRAYCAGLPNLSGVASASSPLTDFLDV
ncbi:thiazole synthase [bacterium]|nr:thiazole synthase [bacterium]